jgi:hypothetical protein
MRVKEAEIVLERALMRFLSDDLETFGDKIGERPMMFRIAHYMAIEAEGTGLRVDCDYNRHHDGLKERLPEKVETVTAKRGVKVKPKRFFPDIVLHERRRDSRNILVCEIKKADDPRGPKGDHES